MRKVRGVFRRTFWCTDPRLWRYLIGGGARSRI